MQELINEIEKSVKVLYCPKVSIDYWQSVANLLP